LVPALSNLKLKIKTQNDPPTCLPLIFISFIFHPINFLENS